ncbi:MAG: site-2 protease family protein [Methanomassiliicoccales archaeon]
MWRTEGGKNLIDRLARPSRFWHAYAFAAKITCLAVGVFIMALLIWEATIVSRIPDDSAPTLEMMLGIPGVNPIIPVIYGIIGLIVAIFVHEYAHGILTRVGQMRIKSLGLLLFIVPIGAFVEPDEQQIANADRKRRTSLYAVGPATNIFLALFCVLLFCNILMASAVPIRENPVILAIGEDSPAIHAGLSFGAQLVEIGGIEIETIDDFNTLSFEPGSLVDVSYYLSGELRRASVTAGLTLVDVSKGLPAYEAGLRPGMILSMLNGTIIRNQHELEEVLALTHPGQTVSLEALYYDQDSEKYQIYPVTSITLTSRKAYLKDIDPNLVNESEPDRGFMGINSAYMGMLVGSPRALIRSLADPLANIKTPLDFFGASLRFIALPFQGLAPIESPLKDLFVPDGLLAWMPNDLFWFISNSIYWIFWINIMVGMTNVLPAVPLDGGYLFKDAVDSIVQKLKRNASEKERAYYVALITYLFAVLVLLLIVWQFIGPRLL